MAYLYSGIASGESWSGSGLKSLGVEAGSGGLGPSEVEGDEGAESEVEQAHPEDGR